MKREELNEAVASKTGGTKADAKKMVDAVLESIKEGVAKSGDVTVAGFGKFTVKTSKARVGRNPRTGESIQIPAKESVKFKPYFS